MTDPDSKDETASLADDARRYRALVESMNEGFGVINRDLQFTFVNRPFASMLGMDQNEIIGMEMASFLSEEDREYWAERLKERFDGESSMYELRWTRADGSELETIISGAPLKDEQGEVIGACAVIRDVTHERAMQQALEESRARFSRVVESLPAGVVLIGLDGRITTANQHTVEMHGFDSKDELVGKRIVDLVAEDHSDEARRHIERALREGQSRGIEYALVRKDGSTFRALVDATMMYDTDGNPQHLIGISRNIEALRRAEAATKRSELTFRRTFEAIPGPAFMWEEQANEDIVLTMVNRAILDKTNGRVEEYIGKSIDAIFGEAPEIQRAVRITMSRGERVSFEMPFSLHSGPHSWFLFDFVRLIDTVVLMITTDLTERKRAEELVKHNEALFRATVESTIDGVMVVSTAGEIIHCNRRFATMMKMDNDELSGDASVVNRRIAAQLENPSFYNVRNDRIERSDDDSFDILFFKDGRVFERTSSPLMIDGEKTGRVWNYRDVTEREQIEDALKESETKYRQLVEQSFQGIIVLRVSPLRIMFSNKVMADMIGLSVQEVLDLKPHEIRDMVHEEDMRTATIRMNALISGGRPKNEPLVLRISRTDGEIRILEAFARSVEYEGIPCIQVVFTDVTERTISKKQIQSEKDRAVLYLDLLSHDFRNMLQVVIGSVALLEERNTDPFSRSAIRNIVESVERCQSLISKVGATEALTLDRLEPIRVYDVIADTVNRLRTLNDDCEFRFIAEDEDATVMADESIHHLFNNILENAIQHNDKARKRIWVALWRGNSGYWIHISDNGPGIADRVKDGLFDISRRFGGVGLHQCKQIVDKMNGTIEIRDRVEGDHTQGAEFVLWLPRIDAFQLDIT